MRAAFSRKEWHMLEKVLLFLLNIKQKRLRKELDIAAFEYDCVCLTKEQTVEVLNIKGENPIYIKNIDDLKELLAKNKK